MESDLVEVGQEVRGDEKQVLSNERGGASSTSPEEKLSSRASHFLTLLALLGVLLGPMHVSMTHLKR